MCDLPAWLPGLIRLEEHGNDGQRYIDAVYARFNTDFIASRPQFQGRTVQVTRQLVRGKERSFWHLIQEGPIEENRIPSIRRCERITWIRRIIEHACDPGVLHWSVKRGRHERDLLFLPVADYLVVLESRPHYWLLWTAYDVTTHRKRRLLQEYEQWGKSRRRP